MQVAVNTKESFAVIESVSLISLIMSGLRDVTQRSVNGSGQNRISNQQNVCYGNFANLQRSVDSWMLTSAFKTFVKRLVLLQAVGKRQQDFSFSTRNAETHVRGEIEPDEVSASRGGASLHAEPSVPSITSSKVPIRLSCSLARVIGVC